MDQPQSRNRTLANFSYFRIFSASFVEHKVVPGQSIIMQSGREALLVETVDGSNALVVVGAGGEASVVEEKTKGKLTKMPLAVLKDLEAVAAVGAGQGPLGAVSGSELMKQVDRFTPIY